MTWFKIDDSFYDHPKVFDAPDCAMALWTRAGCWAARNLTDGFVPSNLPPRLCDDPDTAVRELVRRKLWSRVKDGYRFHDWHRYQPTRESVQHDREAASERKRKERERRRLEKQQADAAAVTTASRRDTPVTPPMSHGGGHSSPTRPDPTRTSYGSSTSSTASLNPQSPDPESSATTPAAKTPEPREDVDRICERLAKWIVHNGSRTPSISDKWRTEARLLIDKDKRPVDEIIGVIDWCQRDSFWKANILSMPKFREKYDTLRIASSNQQGRQNGGMNGYTPKQSTRLHNSHENPERYLEPI